MQIFNKDAAKKIFYHTWYIYPLLVGLVTVLWIWGFQAFHQPTVHQMLTLFFATEIKNESFVKEITNEHYKKEDLREVSTYYSLPSAVGYYSKLKLYLENADILILDQKTIDEFKGYQDQLFMNLTDEAKDKYFQNYDYYTYIDDESNTYTYGLKLKTKGEHHYLEDFMDFVEGYDYYITFSLASKNLGFLNGNNNAYYDSALTFAKYLLEL